MHVTKLPIELEQAIESIIFESKHDRWDPHLEAFEHFESRCQPSDHVYDDRHLDLRDDAYEEVCDELCEACQEDQFHVDGCKEDCNDRVLQCMNEMCGDGDEGWERVFCEPMWKGWKELTSDAKFEPYQKVRSLSNYENIRSVEIPPGTSRALRTRSIPGNDSSQRKEQRFLARA